MRRTAASRSGWDKLWVNVNLATMLAGGEAYGAIRDGAIALKGGRIAWLGRRRDLPDVKARMKRDGGGRWVTPGLVDCHTHLVFAGERAQEFELRLKGATYEQIARNGGGINSTVTATRKASEEALFTAAARRLRSLLAEGVTTIEIKSGYGLDLANELKMLRVARRLGEEFPVTVRTTFLGAHALPAEFAGRQGAYVDLVVDKMLPAVARTGLADAVDAFAEKIAFTPAETERIFAAAKAHKLPVKLHADQLSDLGGAELSAKFSALSADHLEYTSEAGIEAMAQAGTVAVLLPGAFYFLRETKMPPIAQLRQHRVPIALASDGNPGSAPTMSLLLMLNMACTLFRLTPEEALAGVTRNGAKALGLADDRGTLEPGKRADLVIWDIGHPAELSYWLGNRPVHAVVQGGRIVRQSRRS